MASPSLKNVIGALLLVLGVAGPAAADTAGLKIRFGATGTEPADWSGTISVAPGEVREIQGWRFERDDRVVPPTGWRAHTRAPMRKRRSNHPERDRPVPVQPLDNGITVRLIDVTDESIVTVTTAQGAFAFKLSEVPYGATHLELNGAVEIQRTAASRPMTQGAYEDDFPAATIGPDGVPNIAWVRFKPLDPRSPRIQEFSTPPASFDFLAEPQGSDQVWLATLPPGRSTSAVAVTDSGRDVFGTAIAKDGTDRVWVFWAERHGDTYQVWARARRNGEFEPPVRISTGAGNAHSPAATADASGAVWVAWQGVHEGVFRIFHSRQRQDGTFGPPELVSPHAASAWAPAIAATPSGAKGDARVAIVWDTYEKGDYDVWLREYDLEGRPRDAVPAANDADYQARATAAYDQLGNLWLAWEQSGPVWGKDFGALDKKGLGLLENRTIGLIVRGPDGSWRSPAEGLESVMPAPTTGAIPVRKKGAPLSEAAKAALPYLGRPYHNLSRLSVDAAGRPWLLLRSRAVDFRPTVGSMWLSYAVYYEDGAWIGPILIPDSSNLLYVAPAVVPQPEGGVTVIHPTDHRQNRIALPSVYPHETLDVRRALTNPWVNDLFIATLDAPATATPPRLLPAETPPDPDTSPSGETEAERATIAHARKATATVDGKEWKLLRGEFHRHTEFSSDGGSDGPLQDMWRYAIDVADLDWVGNGDHDNGHGRLYPWWLIQKTTDAFHIPDRFTTVFSHERSRPYPEGHRNVIFIQRGIRPLPRLPLSKVDDEGPAPDTEMYYDYVEHFGGISAPHTTGTSMGTDWRNRNDAVEPVVEIYQGSRNSYEMPGAPRTATRGAKRAERPKGFISNALRKGYRLGFVSSSDHHSTHISYAMLWVEDPSREAILDAFRKRRVYAATDDIVADVRMGNDDAEWFMGQELSTEKALPLRVHLDGTAPFARVVIVKDGEEVHIVTPEGDEKNIRFEWVDPEPEAGKTSHYYVRGEQQNRELVWTSPIWVQYEGGS